MFGRLRAKMDTLKKTLGFIGSIDSDSVIALLFGVGFQVPKPPQSR